MRRDFRHDPGYPEDEIPRQTGYKRNKKKHVHEWESRTIGTEIAVSHYMIDGQWKRYEREVAKTMYVCKRCGTKRRWRY